MNDLPARIDHSVLGPTTTPADVDTGVGTAAALGTNLCVPSQYVRRAVQGLADADTGGAEPAVVSVVGFPHGQHESATKRRETTLAVERGADELDVVIDVGHLLAGDLDVVRSNLAAVVDAVDVPVKAIVCSPLLEEANDPDTLETACEIAADVGCAYVKTATGFNGGGVTVDAVERMAGYLPVKASGGIGSWDTAQAMFDAGAERIGASSGDVIVREWRAAREGDA